MSSPPPTAPPPPPPPPIRIPLARLRLLLVGPAPEPTCSVVEHGIDNGYGSGGYGSGGYGSGGYVAAVTVVTVVAIATFFECDELEQIERLCCSETNC
ncbi:hypothetical protein GPALN_014638 [Globodera pallida]|nr:hypothetical protein GPALN_014638 [Globodera pallida]